MSTRLETFLACPHKRVQEYSECCLDCGENIYTTPEEIQREEANAKEQDELKWDDHGW